MAIVVPDEVEVRPTNLSKEISTMINSTMALSEPAENGADIDVLRQMVQFIAQPLMELDVQGRCGAGYDEKTPRGPTATTATASSTGTRASATCGSTPPTIPCTNDRQRFWP